MVIFCGLIFSCRRTTDKPLWNTDIVAPLLQSSLSIGNIIRDTSTFKVNGDKSITIVERQLLMKVGLDSIVKNITAGFQQTIYPTNFKLDNITDTTSITLLQLANAAPPAVGTYIKSYNHMTMPFFPAITNYNLPDQNVNISNFLQSANIVSGTMTITIINNFPVTLSSMDLALNNKAPLSTNILTHTFTNLTPGTSQSYVKDLSGSTIGDGIIASITQVNFPSAFNVPIDLDKAIDVLITVSNIKVSAAKAVFPSTSFLDTTSKRVFTTLGDVQLKKVILASTNIKIEIASTFGDNINFNYMIPKALKNGVPFEFNSTIPAGSIASPSNTVLNYDLADYEFDLTGLVGSDTINTFYDVVKAGTTYSGTLVSLSNNDNLSVKVTLENVKPSYAKGYLGQKTISRSQPVFSTLFNHIVDGTINVETNNTKIVIDNGLGVSSAVNMQYTTATNSRTGKSINYISPNLNTDIPISNATDNPLTVVTTNIDLSANSNSQDFLNILPDRIDYMALYKSNISGNDHTYSEFAYNTSFMDIYLDTEFPLSIKTSNLTLCDTVAFNSQSDPNSKKPVQKGTILVHVENGFPLEANMSMHFLDASGSIIDSLVSSATIKAAAVDANGRVNEKPLSIIPFEADAKKISNILYSKNVIFKVGFTTIPTTSYMKIYSDYSITFKLVGDIQYSVQ